MRALVHVVLGVLLLSLEVHAESPASRPVLNLKSAQALPVAATDGQPLRLVGDYTGPDAVALVFVDGAKLADWALKTGAVDGQFRLPLVTAQTRSSLTVQIDGQQVAATEVIRRPVRQVTVYITPHSHVDIGYTELQPQIEKKQVNNLLTALDLVDKTQSNPPGSQYRWTVEAAWTLDNFVAQQPDAVARLEKALKAKHVELDSAFANMLTALCRPEELLRAYARGAEYGRRFGVPVTTAQISDVPGYTWGTVAALSSAGVKYFSIAPNYCDRIGTTMTAWQDKPFYWQTPDGKNKVLCWVPFTGYAWSHLVRVIGPDQVAALVAHLEEVQYPYDLTYIRWSGHGDNAVPDPAIIEAVKSWNQNYTWPKLKLATISEPFEELEKRYGRDLQVVGGDWTSYWEDGAASSAMETAMNRATAERLVAAETLTAMLRLPAQPTDAFQLAWRDAMLYSEHTWGAHCSISEPENALTTGQWAYKRGYAISADSSSRKLLEAALADGTDVPDAIDVFNVSGWTRSDVVLVPGQLSRAGDEVCDAGGKLVPSQRLSDGELAFLAEDVPSLGSKRFLIRAGAAQAGGTVKVGPTVLENTALRVEIDPQTGNIRKLLRRGDELDLVSDDSAGLNEYLYVEGAGFTQPRRAPAPAITVRDPGPLVATLAMESDAPGCRKLWRELRLTAAGDFVELTNVLDKLPAGVKPVSKGGNPQDANNGKEAVHFAFPFHVPDGQIRMDLPWSVVRPEADQIPGSCRNWFTVQRWVDISSDGRGVTWSPIDAPLVQIGGITATLIGSQTNPQVWQAKTLPSTSLYSWAMNNYWHTNYRASQEGVTTFRYAIRPHAAYSAVEAQRFGMERSQPLIVVPARDRAAVPFPRPKLSSSDVFLTACKPADDGEGYILRLFAGAGKDVNLDIDWQGRVPSSIFRSDPLESRGDKLTGPISLKAWEILTLRVE